MVTAITIHCAATPNGIFYDAADVDAWHKERGFKRNPAWLKRNNASPYRHIGYQYVIGIDGTVEKGREEQETGAHVAGHNTGNIGICMIGTDKFTRAQWDSLRSLVDGIMTRHPITRIMGHRDWPGVKKVCPGFEVAAWVAGGVDAVSDHILKDQP